MNIEINKESQTPVYRQIVEQVAQLVQKGELRPGDRLMPERDLSISLGISRGTVSKAYETLANNNVVVNRQGRGTFIARNQDVMSESRKDRAVELIGNTIQELERMRFTHREIGTIFHVLLTEREHFFESFSIAAVDCNPEALGVFEEQLRYISNIQIVRFLLDDVLVDDAVKQLLEYDLILTTSTHYGELLLACPELGGRLVQAAVSPSQQTIIDLAGIKGTGRVCAICRSEHFMGIMRSKLVDFEITASRLTEAYESPDLDLDAVLSGCLVLIVPPDSPILNQKLHVDALRRFRERGGRIIEFRYQMERGTLLHIEEKISQLMEAR